MEVGFVAVAAAMKELASSANENVYTSDYLSGQGH